MSADRPPTRMAVPTCQDKPLAGRTIVVTRPRHQAAELVARLEEFGAEALEFPVIKTLDPLDWSAADHAISNLEMYEWVVFTSANAVHRFFERLALYDSDARALAGCRVAAVGQATAEHLASRGIRADFVPSDHHAEGLIEGFLARGVGKGSRVLLPRAQEAREILPETLRERGARVDVVPVYRTVRAEPDHLAIERLASGPVDAVVFTSPSTLRSFVELVEGTPAADVLSRSALVSIGPVTTRAADELGLRVTLEAYPHTTAGLVRMVCEHFSAEGGS